MAYTKLFRYGRFFLTLMLVIGMTATGFSGQQTIHHQSQATQQLAKVKVVPVKVAAQLNASPDSYSGKCPALIKFNGKISVNRPAIVKYKFIRSDNASAPVQTLTFKKAGTKIVNTTWQLGGPSLPSYTGWEAIEILSPVQTRSNKAQFKIRCGARVQPGGVRPVKRLPDLTITNITLDEQCSVVVHAKNNGPGSVPDKVWTEHTPDSSAIYLYFNGKRWGGQTIWKFDAGRNLQHPGGTVTMSSNLKVSGTATIQAVIDHTNKVVEKDEKNNAMKKRLTCKPASAARPDITARPRPTIRPGTVTLADPGPEDCVSFNPQTTAVKQVQGNWKIVDGSHWMFDFGSKKNEADRALAIIKKYRMNQSCFVGRPNPSFKYMLREGSAPAGAFAGEDCVSFNPNTATVQQAQGNWKIVDGSHWMFDFGSNESEARKSLAIIKKYGFTRSCFVGRPGPSFYYLRK